MVLQGVRTHNPDRRPRRRRNPEKLPGRGVALEGHDALRWLPEPPLEYAFEQLVNRARVHGCTASVTKWFANTWRGPSIAAEWPIVC